MFLWKVLQLFVSSLQCLLRHLVDRRKVHGKYFAGSQGYVLSEGAVSKAYFSSYRRCSQIMPNDNHIRNTAFVTKQF